MSVECNAHLSVALHLSDMCKAGKHQPFCRICLWLTEQIFYSTCFHQITVVKHCDMRADLLHNSHFMCDNHDRNTTLLIDFLQKR